MKIENVKVVNHNETIENADVIIENGKISQIIKKDGIGSKVLIPGFIDSHTHGYMGNDFMDGTKETEEIAEAFAKAGVTSIYATIMTRDVPKMLQSLKDIAAAKKTGANILGVHAEGPFISHEKKGAHKPEDIKEGDIPLLNQMYEASNGMLKKISYSPETCSDEFIKEMVKLGIMPTVGHTAATMERTIEAIDLGSYHCTHLWNGMSGVENRNPGAAQGIIYDDRMYAEIIADGIHVDYETLLFTLKTKTPEKIIMVSDSIRAAGLEDGEFTSGGVPIIKKGMKITLKELGSIAGSAATMHLCFKNLVNDLGVDLEDAVKMSSYNTAVTLNMEGKGIIKEGMDADLVILDKSNNIDAVYINGELVN